MVRLGLGRDSHAFDTEKKPLVLGGVKLSDSGGLRANSDGDVVLHALFNALSQACGGESIGHYADPLCKRGITDSSEYLKVALDMVGGINHRINNIGIMVEAKRPFLSRGQIADMKRSVARLASVDERDVGITFTSGEGLTAFGRGEGILAEAVVSLIEIQK